MTLEFTAVRASVAQAVKQAEQARALRIESIDRQLPALESDLATKQQEVAALRAERERLHAQTGHDLVAEILGPLEYRRVKDIPQALFDAHDDGVWLDESARAGRRSAHSKPKRGWRGRAGRSGTSNCTTCKMRDSWWATACCFGARTAPVTRPRLPTLESTRRMKS